MALEPTETRKPPSSHTRTASGLSPLVGKPDPPPLRSEPGEAFMPFPPPRGDCPSPRLEPEHQRYPGVDAPGPEGLLAELPELSPVCNPSSSPPPCSALARDRARPRRPPKW